MNWTKSKWRIVFACFLLISATLGAFWTTIDNDFTNYDDDEYVTENPHVLPGLTWKGSLWALTNFYSSNWHPVTWWSHMLDVQFYGTKPWGHHLTNLILHLANTLLLFLVLKRMTGFIARSAFVAALFALHPLHVESVAWIAERKDVLSGFFFLLTLFAYAVYAERASDRGQPDGIPGKSGSAVKTPARWLWYAGALVLFALGLMSKPMLVTTPFVLLLLDYWPLRRFQIGTGGSKFDHLGPLLREKIPFFALSVGSSIITILAQNQGGSVAPLDYLSAGERVANAIVAYGRYLGKTLWPINLAAFYPFPGEWPWWQLAASAALLALMTTAVFLLARRRPYLFTGWLWFLGTLVPVIGLMQVGFQSMADRYTYLPLIGIFVMAVFGFAEMAEGRRWANILVGTAGAIMLCCSALATRHQVRFWVNTRTLFEHGLAVTHDNYIAHQNLGLMELRNSRLGEAKAHFSEVLRMKPDFIMAHNNLGFTLLALNQPDEAVPEFLEALRLKPDLVPPHFNLANALLKQGQQTQAFEHFAEALRLRPDFAEAHYAFGTALSQAGRLDEATAHFTEALRIRPDYAEAHNNWGSLLAKQGKESEAISHYSMALKLKPDFEEAACNLGAAMANEGKWVEAAAWYGKAIQLNHDFAPAHYGLGLIFRQQGKLTEAVTSLSTVLRIDPSHAGAHDQLGMFLAGQGNLQEAVKHFESALRVRPADPALHCHLAGALNAQGKTPEAIADYRRALELNPESSEALNNLAWILAAHPEPGFRDGPEAVRLAEHACQLTQNHEAVLVGTLAAAYAESGRFSDAVATAEKARELAAGAGQTNVAQKNLEMLELYRAKKAYHETAAASQKPGS